MKNYKSLDDINQHLKILRLKADIYQKRTEIQSKIIKHTLSPSNLIAEGLTTLGQKYFYNKIMQAVLRKLKLF